MTFIIRVMIMQIKKFLLSNNNIFLFSYQIKIEMFQHISIKNYFVCYGLEAGFVNLNGLLAILCTSIESTYILLALCCDVVYTFWPVYLL